MPRQIRTFIRPSLHDYVCFDVIHISKYPFLKTFQIWKYISNKFYLFFSHQKKTPWWEKKIHTHTHTHIYIYIYVDHLKYFFQIAAFSNIQTIFRKCCYWKNILNGKCLYLYINFRSIVLFSDGKIADRQTNNSSKSFI